MMRPSPPTALLALAVLLTGWSALAAQDKSTLKAPDGLGVAEFKGYEAWQPVAVSQTRESLKVISANPEMIKAFEKGLRPTARPSPKAPGP